MTSYDVARQNICRTLMSGMAAQRFMSNDFRASCRDFATLENPPAVLLRTLAAVFALLDCRAVTDFLPPLAMLAAGERPGRGTPRYGLADTARHVIDTLLNPHFFN